MILRPLSRRHALIALIGLAALPALDTKAQAVRVEGGTPLRLPLGAVDDLGIVLPAEIEEEPVDLAVLSLGAVGVPSGRLTGVDALVLEGAPYVPGIAPGRYPLQLVIATLPDGEERVAFAQIKFADRPAKTWVNALIEGEDPELPDGEISVFEVESGFAALFDASALALWRRALSEDASLVAQLERVLQDNRRRTWTWARVRAGSGDGVLFTSGFGEGEYGAYWGQAADGEVVSLVLDLDLLDWEGLPEEAPVTT
ncbi:MAG TPA: DUF4241 domain-containing protein [Burkholderiaceae bacterium]|nr:DUF4241 domain-containing protein [Burkholderiaceae bacterium]